MSFASWVNTTKATFDEEKPFLDLFYLMLFAGTAYANDF